MRRKLHHTAPLFFLLLLLLPFTGLLFLQGAQRFLKSNVDERKAGKKTETVVLAEAAVRWEKTGKELWIGDRLFDIESYTTENGRLTATGFFDEEETSVFNLLRLCSRAEKSGVLQRLFLLFQCFAACVVLLQVATLFRQSIFLQTLLAFFLPSPFLFVAEQPPRNRFATSAFFLPVN